MQLLQSLLVAVLASVAASQSVSSLVAQLPSCALTCLATATTASGCGISDYKCQCGSAKDAITKSATPCVLSKCSTDEALKTNGIVTDICKVVGGSSSSSAAAGGGATTQAAGGAAPAVSPSLGSSFPPSSFASYTVKPTAVSPTTTVAATASATTSAPIQVSSNPAVKAHPGFAMAGAAMLAAFAL